MGKHAMALIALLFAFGCVQNIAPQPPAGYYNQTDFPSNKTHIVGVYYMPGWQSGSGFWDDLKPFPERTPLLGYYPEEETWVADWHLRWASEHGIDFFAYDWFWDSGKKEPYLEHALNAHLNSQYRGKVKFCVVLVNHEPFDKSVENLDEITDYWISNYFWRQEYLKIDGKPVVIIFSAYDMRQTLGRFSLGHAIWGKKSAAEAIAGMRERVKKAGYKNVYLIGGMGDPPTMRNVGELVIDGYDAFTAYNYVPISGEEIAPYDSLAENYSAIWAGSYEVASAYSQLLAGTKSVEDANLSTDELRRQGLSDEALALAGSGRDFEYVIATTPGWDAEPWKSKGGVWNYVRTNSTPEKFRGMLERAKNFSSAHENLSGMSSIILIEAWNEFGEGSYIEPTSRWGFAYLDAVRHVFANSTDNHSDEYPQAAIK